jgi:hypothetical protein
MSIDWLPTWEQDFVDLCQKWKAGLEYPANVTAFDWKQVETAAALAVIDAFLTARAACEKNDSSRNRRQKNEAKQTVKSVLRDFANASIRYNKLMTEEDKRFYGIHTPDQVPTPVPAPATYPEAKPDTSIIRQVTIHFQDSVTKKRAKPHGVRGAELRWALLDHPPESVAELMYWDFDTAMHFTLIFGEKERGQRLYFCLRWESNTKLKGPYGEIYSAIIP